MNLFLIFYSDSLQLIDGGFSGGHGGGGHGGGHGGYSSGKIDFLDIKSIIF